MFDLALQNLLSPMVLFFGLGLFAASMRSDLTVPDAVAKFLALYLLLSIGFRGGAEVGHHGLTAQLAATIAAGVLLSFVTPFIAFAVLRTTSHLNRTDAAAIAGHYGSISAVTFVAVTGVLGQLSIPFDGYLVAVAAAMETPAIFAALFIVRTTGHPFRWQGRDTRYAMCHLPRVRPARPVRYSEPRRPVRRIGLQATS